jgi:SAM-dependent methyltransferase
LYRKSHVYEDPKQIKNQELCSDKNDTKSIKKDVEPTTAPFWKRDNNSGSVHCKLADPTRTVRQMTNYFKRYLISRYVKLGMSVADLACGSGGDFGKFAHCGISRYLGFDISKHSLKEARKRYFSSGLEHVIGTLNPQNFELNAVDLNSVQLDLKSVSEAPVDIVSMQMALHYFDLDIIFKSAAQILQPEGFFLVTTVDHQRLPEKDVTDHPLMSIVYSDASKTKYRFSFTGFIRDLEERVVPRTQLFEVASKYNFHVIEDFSIQKVLTLIEEQNRSVPTLTAQEWDFCNLYQAFVFQFKPPVSALAPTTTTTQPKATAKSNYKVI